MNGKSDPYVIVQAGRQEKKSKKIIKKTLDPVWDEEIILSGPTFRSSFRRSSR